MTLTSAAASRLRPSSASEVPITSRWCNRALRPLTSTILRLERHWKLNPLRSPNSSNDSTDAAGSSGWEATAKEKREGSESESAPDDPTWVPGGAVVQKRIKHKYSARAGGRSRVVVRSPKTQKLLPGEFYVPTPLIKGEGRRGGGREAEEVEGSANATVTESVEESSVANGRRGSSKRKPPAYAGWNSQRTWKDECDEYNDPSYIAIAQAIFQVWDTFLTMTAPEQGGYRGARSLMAMALDTTSMYIAREQGAVDNCEEKDETVDVADVIFTELEGIYGTSIVGWKPLRSLVRLHGIRLVCEAIWKRWISPMLARQLVLNSIDSSAYDAAREILSALLSVTRRIEGPSHLDCTLFSSRNFGVFHTLATYVNKASHLSFFFREVGGLLRDGTVPVEWIATESMKPFVTHAIQSISCEDDDCAASVLFIGNIVLAASGSDTFLDTSALETLLGRTPHNSQDHCLGISKVHHHTHRSNPSNPMTRTSENLATALNNSISSILGILCSAHIVRSETTSRATSSGASSMHHILARLSAIIQHDIAATSFDLTQDRSRSELLRIGYILMADYLLSCSGSRGSEEEQPNHALTARLLISFEYFTRPLKNRKDLTSSLSAFVINVSHRCGRARAEDGFAQLELFTEFLISNRLQWYPTLRALLSKVAVDAALEFAESTLHPDHHSWAAQIQTRVAAYTDSPVSQDGPLPLTPSLYLSKIGYVWEDSIGEWIATVPVNRGQKGPRMHKDRKRSLPNLPADDPSTLSDSDHGRTSRGSSTFSSSSERYASSVTSSDSASPLCSRKRRRIVDSPEVAMGRRTRTMSPWLLDTPPPGQLRSGRERSWNRGHDGQADSNGVERMTFSQSTHSQTSTKPSVSGKLASTRPLRERKEANNSRLGAFAVEIKSQHKEATSPQKAVDVVIFNDKESDPDEIASYPTISDKRQEGEPAESDNDDNEDQDDDDDDDILSKHPPPPRYHLRRSSIVNKFTPRTPSPMAMITRLRSTRSSSSLGRTSFFPTVEDDCGGSSDDELSFL
ncbi:hypothetical protein AJ79_06935 [Helicocarpus griseus UAMH5409]|uniref:Uncharacterized protein n=1 Tax=Helicocarpus griseus UAMH5409 TaxID=1447875 RepID=A0A2B7X8J2_9EURO|nr:hypothetical protein AJ79_06935 [Helicocarpus griseus UAMH5409]